jgi:hypothetical protein
MLQLLRGKVSDRKLRLFACACCRRMWRLLPNPRNRAFVEAAERCSEAEADWDELCAALHGGDQADRGWLMLKALSYSLRPRPRADVASCALVVSVLGLIRAPDHLSCGPAAREAATAAARAAQAGLLRDVFNPFRAAAGAPALGSRDGGALLKLAEAAYEERELPQGTLDRACLAVLADALEEAGCTDACLLNHLRGPGPHVRGCWAVDAVQGRG